MNKSVLETLNSSVSKSEIGKNDHKQRSFSMIFNIRPFNVTKCIYTNFQITTLLKFVFTFTVHS